MAGVLRTKTELTRQAFLYGVGDGKPITSVAGLCAVAGVHENTVQNHMPKWLAEREEILLKSPGLGIELRLSAQTLAKHKQDVETYRILISEVKESLKALPVVCESLLDLARKCTPADSETIVSLVDKYLSVNKSRGELQAQLLKLERRWADMVGAEAARGVAENRERALASGRAKIQVAREAAADGDTLPHKAAGRVIETGGVFQVSPPLPDPRPSESLGDEDGLG